MNAVIWFEKYGFLLTLVFCLGIFTPDFSSKISMMDHELDAVTDSLADSNAFKQLFWIVMFLFFSFRFFLNVKMKVLKPIIMNKLFILIAVCVVALLSALWSNYPMIAMKRAIFQILFCSSIALALCFSFYHGTIENSLKSAAVICIITICIAVLLGAGFNEELKLAGYLKSKNTMGSNLVVLIVISHMWIKSFDISSRLLNALLLVLFVLLVLTQSKTSIALCVLYFMLTTLSLFKIKIVLSMLTITFFSIFVLIPGISYHINEYQHIALYVDADFFTGRGIIWDALYYDLGFFDKITLGYGYGSYFGVGVIPFVLDDKYSFLQYISSAHNGYLQLLLQFGVIGTLAIFILMMFALCNINNLYINAALIIPLLQNVTESSIFRDSNMAWFIILVIIFSSVVYRFINESSHDNEVIIDAQ